MSPIAGVGINVAIQDAVEAANLLWQPLRAGRVEVRDLARVQRRRELPVRLTQAFQGVLQAHVVRPSLAAGTRTPTLPMLFRVALQTPVLKDLPARLVGLGLRRPRVRAPLQA
jgi:2-polyprenyl-6-methoxyphenol hydroxylase-like FAD-dependent oxidoreductase